MKFGGIIKIRDLEYTIKRFYNYFSLIPLNCNLNNSCSSLGCVDCEYKKIKYSKTFQCEIPFKSIKELQAFIEKESEGK